MVSSRDLSHTSSVKVLTDLLARMEAAEGADRELDALIECALFDGAPSPRDPDRVCRKDGNGYGYTQAFAPYTALLGSAVALVERALPGWVWSVGNLTSGGGHAYLMRAKGAALIGGNAPTPTLALLCALVKALIAADSEASSGQTPGGDQ